jgi:hypothetical protein
MPERSKGEQPLKGRGGVKSVFNFIIVLVELIKQSNSNTNTQINQSQPHHIADDILLHVSDVVAEHHAADFGSGGGCS